MDDKQTVRVTILSRPYSLRVSGDPREVEAVAASVNDLMLSIAGRSPDSDSTRIAVLACLHLADQLRHAQKELEELRLRKDTGAAEYAVMLEKLFPELGVRLFSAQARR